MLSYIKVALFYGKCKLFLENTGFYAGSLQTSTQHTGFASCSNCGIVSSIALLLLPHAGKTVSYFFKVSSSSTLQDIQRKHPTEIDILSGKIIQLGEAHGIDVPVNRMLYRQIKLLEANY